MPPESIVAFFNTAQKYGVYPIDIQKIDEKLRELAAMRPVIKMQIPIPD